MKCVRCWEHEQGPNHVTLTLKKDAIPEGVDWPLCCKCEQSFTNWFFNKYGEHYNRTCQESGCSAEAVNYCRREWGSKRGPAVAYAEKWLCDEHARKHGFNYG